MNKKINQSLNFLLAEYKRLKLKVKNKTITNEEKDTFKRLFFFYR